MSKIQNGFTLAEVLITLGVISIVAAMTIPNLIAAYKKRSVVVKLQKAISVWANASRLMEDNIGQPTSEELRKKGAKNIWNEYYAPFFSTSTICENYQKCGYSSQMPWGHGTYFNDAVNMGVYTNDGFFYFVQFIGGQGQSVHNGYCIDLNGSKPPNKYGKDFFCLTRNNKNQELLPDCVDKSDSYVNKQCSTNGDCCLEKIKRAGWVIDKSYPW